MCQFSVVVCAYNEEEHIVACVKSLINQDYDNEKYEIIVMNNSSDDNTLKVLNEFLVCASLNRPRISVVTIEHVSLSISRNTSAKIAKAEWVLFVDADSVADKNMLNNFNGNINSSINLAYGRVLNNNNKRVSRFFYDLIYDTHYVINQDVGAFIGACMLIRKEVLENEIFFRDGLRRGDDTDYLRQYLLQYNSATVCYVESSSVNNFFPSTIYEWINTFYIEGESYSIIDSLYGEKDKNSKRKMDSKFLYVLLVIMSIVGYVYTSSVYYMIAAVSLMMVRIARPLFFQIYGLKKYKRLVADNHSWYTHVIIFFTSVSIRDFGYFVATIKSYFRSIAPVSGVSRIIEVKQY